MGKNIIKENRKIGLKEHAINSTFVAYNICNISFEKYDIQITLKLIKQRQTKEQFKIEIFIKNLNLC